MAPPKHDLCDEVIAAGQRLAGMEAHMEAIDERERQQLDLITEVRTDVKTLLATRAAGSGALALLRSVAPWLAVIVACAAVALR